MSDDYVVLRVGREWYKSFLAKTLPLTIKQPWTFMHMPSAGLDGAWDWKFVSEAIARVVVRAIEITPMDFDGVVEINHFKLVFETKQLGKEVPSGQQRTLNSELDVGLTTVVYLWDKLGSAYWYWEAWSKRGAPASGATEDVVKQIAAFIEDWARRADQAPKDAWLKRLGEVVACEGKRAITQLSKAVEPVEPELDNDARVTEAEIATWEGSDLFAATERDRAEKEKAEWKRVAAEAQERRAAEARAATEAARARRLAAEAAAAERASRPVDKSPRFNGPIFEHPCVAPGCDKEGSFGFGVKLREGKLGTWYCRDHRHLGTAAT